MTTRTTSKTVTFNWPFLLAGLDEEQPAGIYQVETDEERIEDASFVAYRRTATVIHLHAPRDRASVMQTLVVDPRDLERALLMDQRLAGPALSPEAQLLETRSRDHDPGSSS